jgi:hypothetical protein
MVLWRSTSSFALLLQISRSPPKTVPRSVTSITPLFPAACIRSSPLIPRDNDHDPEIDLITLRRRVATEFISKRSLEVTEKNEPETKPKSKEERPSDRISEPIVMPPRVSAASSNSTTTSESNEENTPYKVGHALPKEGNTAFDRSSLIPDTSASKDFDRGGSNGVNSQPNNPSINNLDPFLVPYLRSLQSKPSKLAKRPVSLDRQPGQQDLDIDLLRPNDIRATYISRTKRAHGCKENGSVDTIKSTSGEPGIIPDHLIHAGIQHLNLPSSDGKVVIPKSVLLRLIEKTINLSGAAVHGDDVIIERYSPTWHRFARLLRTSDLHKISTLTDSPVSTRVNHKQKTGLPEFKDVPRQESKEQAAFSQPVPGLKGDSSSSPQPVMEREYVILALDTRKKRVATTRFRRLLDGSSNVTLPSSESLLKVEHLNKFAHFHLKLIRSSRYLPYLKPLETEGFYVTAAGESGIVLSRNLNPDDAVGDATDGWLRRLLGRKSPV